MREYNKARAQRLAAEKSKAEAKQPEVKVKPLVINASVGCIYNELIQAKSHIEAILKAIGNEQ